jgi:predicted phosphate transport protein (TIGR00153 family)
VGKRGGYDYFNFFIEMMECARDGAKLLEQTLEDFHPERLKTVMEQMHAIEHSGDMKKHEMTEHLAAEFLPPIDREDISRLAAVQDDLIDSIEDVLISVYMYGVMSCREDVSGLTNVITTCTKELVALLKDFHHLRKANDMKKHIIEVNRLEEVGDKLHLEAMRKLYMTEKDAVLIGVWKDIYNFLEKCCDECEHVADAIEEIVMKNA